jgi:hypothetical protein
MRPIPLDLLRDRIPWRRYAGGDEYGDPTYDDPVILTCYLEKRARRVMDPQGRLIMITGTLIIAGEIIPDIDPKDLLLMAPTVEEPEGEPATILGTSLLKDPRTGVVHHSEVLLG